VTTGDVLLNIKLQIAAVLAAILNGSGQPLFGATPRIFSSGEPLDTTVMPAADWELDDEVAEQKVVVLSHTLPWLVDVYFDDKAEGSNLHTRHARMYGRVKDAVMNNPKLNGAVVDTRYVGGGTKLTPRDTEQAPDRWSFTLRFESLYRHLPTDSGVAA